MVIEPVSYYSGYCRLVCCIEWASANNYYIIHAFDCRKVLARPPRWQSWDHQDDHHRTAKMTIAEPPRWPSQERQGDHRGNAKVTIAVTPRWPSWERQDDHNGTAKMTIAGLPRWPLWDCIQLLLCAVSWGAILTSLGPNLTSHMLYLIQTM